MWLKARARVFRASVFKWKAPLYLSRRVYHANEVLISRYGKLWTDTIQWTRDTPRWLCFSLSLSFFSSHFLLYFKAFSRLVFHRARALFFFFFSIASNFSQGDALERKILAEYKKNLWDAVGRYYSLYISLLSFLKKKIDRWNANTLMRVFLNLLKFKFRDKPDKAKQSLLHLFCQRYLLYME